MTDSLVTRAHGRTSPASVAVRRNWASEGLKPVPEYNLLCGTQRTVIKAKASSYSPVYCCYYYHH